MGWRTGILAACVSVALFRSGPLHASERAPEEEVKAAIIFNTLLFVQWPQAAAGGQLSICAPEDNAAFRALKKRFDGELVHETRLLVRSPIGRMEDLRDCNAVFIEGDNPAMLYHATTAAGGHPVLIIGEGPRALEYGAMIGLSLSGDRYVFDINLFSVRRAGLAVSSRLIRLARKVLE